MPHKEVDRNMQLSTYLPATQIVKGLRRLIWVLNFVTASLGGIGAVYAFTVVALPPASVSGFAGACTEDTCNTNQLNDFGKTALPTSGRTARI
jgi:hypothetical protein